MGVFWRVVFISHLFVGLSLHIKIPKGHPIWIINYWECMEGHLTSPHPFFGAPCHLRKEANRTPWKAQTKGTPATQTWTERDGSGLYWWFGPFPNQGREGSQSVAIVPKVVLCLNDVGFWIVFPLWFDQPPRGIYIIAPFGEIVPSPLPLNITWGAWQILVIRWIQYGVPKLDDGWPESEKDVFQAALRMVVVKDSRWIVGEFYMSYGKIWCEIWCEKVRLIKKRIFGKGHQMTCVLQPEREKEGAEIKRVRERERERESKRERENERGGVERKHGEM